MSLTSYQAALPRNMEGSGYIIVRFLSSLSGLYFSVPAGSAGLPDSVSPLTQRVLWGKGMVIPSFSKRL